MQNLPSELLATYFKTAKASFEFGGVQNLGVDFDYITEVSSVYSAQIEGNSLDVNSYFNQKEFQGKTKTKDFLEIQDLSKAYQFAFENEFTFQNILKVHSLLSKSILDVNSRGKVRPVPIGVFGSRGLIYMAVEPEFVDRELRALMSDLVELIKQDLSETEAVFLASVVHLRIAQIHPFIDGNGRLARLCEKWFLKNCLPEKSKLIWSTQSERYYFENKKEYYSCINIGQDYYNLDFSLTLNFSRFVERAF